MANEFKSEEQLLKDLDQAKTMVVVGGFYGHYKHPGEKSYQVVDVGINENTEEVCVIYKSLKMGVLWIRTLDNFLSMVEWEGKQVKRFDLVL